MSGAEYAEALRGEFAVVSAAVGVRRVEVELAGRAIRLDFAGPALANRLAPAFGHLSPASTREPELTIEAWDRASAGRAAPAPPWDVAQYAPRERIRGIDPRELRAAYDLGAGILSLYRPGSGVGVWHAAESASLPRWVVRTPFRNLIGWWAEEVGLTFAHASVVGRDGACILLPGRSGSGKSTTALAAAVHGLDFLADDLCLLDTTACTAHAPYQWAKAEADAIARLPSLASTIVDTEEGQSLVRPPNLVRSATVVGIALPMISGQPSTTVAPATAAEAVFALGPSTLIEGNGAGAASLARLAQLARALPAVHLQLGTDLAEVASVVDGLVNRWTR